MRRLVYWAIVSAMLIYGINIVSVPASAQGFKFQQDAGTEPHTKLQSDDWAMMMQTFINAKPIIGKPEIYVVNATPYEMIVMCDKWVLVGDKPYIKTNPHSLPAWSVTLVNAEGFDGYCKNGITGQASNAIYQGMLNAADHSFSDSTFATFSDRTRR